MNRLVLLPIILLGIGGSVRGDDHLGPVTDIEVIGDKVYSCSQAGILVGSGQELKFLLRPLGRTISIEGVGEGESSRLLFVGGEPGVAGALGFVDLRSGERRDLRTQGKDLLYDVARLDSEVVVVAQATGEVCLVEGKRQVAEPAYKHTAAVRALATSPDGKWLASAGHDGVVILSAISNGALSQSRKLLDHTAGVECLVFSPDSKRLASGSLDSKVRLHEVTGGLVRTYDGLGMEDEPVAGRVQSQVLSLAWGAKLVAGTSKGLLYELSLGDDTTTVLARKGSDSIHALAFDSAGRLVIGSQGKLEVLAQGR